MTRTYEPWVEASVRDHLDMLLRAAEERAVSGYRELMTALGHDLAARLSLELPAMGNVLIVTTVEDADFLCRGVIDELRLRERTRLFCYWNERRSELDVAPIVSKYEEPLDNVAAVVVVKSIISGACVVRTNLAEALTKVHTATPIFVLSPVMHVDAHRKLRREFSTDVADRFRYVFAAKDSEKDGDNIKPGIGGSVYELLGLGDKHSKNRYRPKLLAERALVT